MDLRDVFGQAVERHKKGDLAEAERLYRLVIAGGSPPAPALHLLGTIRFQLGKHEEALDLFARALKINPRDPGIQWAHANALSALSRFDAAVSAYDKAIALSPNLPEAFYNRGYCQSKLNRHKDALASFDAALRIKPRFFEALYQRGEALEALSEPNGALESYKRALEMAPTNSAALDKLADLLRKIGQPEDALVPYGFALNLAPADIAILHRRAQLLLALDRPETALSDFDKILSIDRTHMGGIRGRVSSLQRLERDQDALAFLDGAQAYLPNVADLPYLAGVIRQELRQTAEALALYDKTLAINSKHAGAWNNKGAIYLSLGELPEAFRSFQNAASADPHFAEAWSNLGNYYKSQGQFDKALESYDKGLTVRPDLPWVLHNRGLLLWEEFKDVERADRDLRRAYALDPDSAYLRGDLLHLHMQIADWSHLAQDKAGVDRENRTHKRAIRPFMYLATCEKASDMKLCTTIFASNEFPAREPIARPPRQAPGKIRLGYLSADFRDQATAQLMVGLYEKHDKSRFEVIAFDNGRNDGSKIRARLENAFDKIVDIANLSDMQAASSVAAHGIDILVNLNGYFGKPRMGVFAYRPAPVQVNYLGFPGTLGADYMDYIIADRHVIPEQDQHQYIEQIVYMPDTYQVNDSKRFLPTARPPREAFGLPENATVFCSFNQSYKLTPEIFHCWMQILAAVDGSVLWLLQSSSQFRDNLCRHAASQGIEPGRLIFAPFAPIEEHLTRLGLADLFLDCLPCNAHTTASDALWAGVPVLTCTGNTFTGRVATSLLHAIDMPELVTETLEAYRDTAIALAKAPNRLQSLRDKLLKSRFQSALFDTDRFRKYLESAFTTMHDRAVNGAPPMPFSVGD